MARALVLWACVGAAVTAHGEVAAAAERPNIVFILADDLGWTDLACYIAVEF